MKWFEHPNVGFDPPPEPMTACVTSGVGHSAGSSQPRIRLNGFSKWAAPFKRLQKEEDIKFEGGQDP